MPDCGRRSITRSASSTPNTSRTEARLAPNEFASSRSPGSRPPGAPCALSILSSSALTNARLSPVATPAHLPCAAPARTDISAKPLDGQLVGPAMVSIWSDQFVNRAGLDRCPQAQRMLFMPPLPNSAAARDIAYYVHPQTSLRRHEQDGPVIVSRGEGVFIFDDAGNRYIETVAGLWRGAPGFSASGPLGRALYDAEQH